MVALANRSKEVDGAADKNDSKKEWSSLHKLVLRTIG
jgi:hypothetical protein